MKTRIFIFLSCISLAVFFACQKNASYPIQVRMTDAPGDYDEVNIDLQSVEVHTEEDGWVTLNTNKGIYDLTNLTNGTDVMIADDELPSGKISQVRLVLGTNNTLKVDSITYDLETPSAQQSGLKLQVHDDLEEGITYTLLLDFDAAKSIVERGNGTYALKPVIRVITQATSGAIKGMVDPAASGPAVYAVSGTDSFSTYPDASGYFMIKGLAAGTYSVVFRPSAPLAEKTVTGVGVTIGNVTDIGTVTIP
ncbi:MAG: DUF4382 domain-containing protein [Bacteroidota bacterium]|nr:DUF4382 domain-containing protein [Bacteroidota bacterium]